MKKLFSLILVFVLLLNTLPILTYAAPDDMTDTDGDGLPDEWERHGVDIDGDGVVDIPLDKMGANPKIPDIFLEVDWMEQEEKAAKVGTETVTTQQGISLCPSKDALEIAAYQFKQHGIRLHIDAGYESKDYVTGNYWKSLSGGNAIPYSDNLELGSSYENWNALMQKNFDSARARVFRHCIFVNRINGTNSSGLSNDTPGQYFLVGGMDGRLKELGVDAEAAALMHQLGHALGLYHGGKSEDGKGGSKDFQKNYLSVMNSLYQISGVNENHGIKSILYFEGSDELPGIASDWDGIVFAAGSIGTLKASALTKGTGFEELTYDRALKEGLLGKPGECILQAPADPGLYQDCENQSLTLRVINLGSADTKPTLKLTSLDSTPFTFEKTLSLAGDRADKASCTVEIPLPKEVVRSTMAFSCELIPETGSTVSQKLVYFAAKPKSVNLQAGETDSLVTDKALAGVHLTWSSADSSIAAVENGVILGVSSGTTRIFCRTDLGQTVAFQVNVSGKAQPKPETQSDTQPTTPPETAPTTPPETQPTVPSEPQPETQPTSPSEPATHTHTCEKPQFTWDTDMKCTAAFVCSVCGDKKEVPCSVTSVTTDATEKAEGKITYTAAVSFSGKSFTDTRFVILPVKAHTVHSPAGYWSTNSTSHWHACSGCNEKLDLANHSGGTATCSRQAVCSTCGEFYGSTAAHTPGPAATATTAQTCTVCGKVLAQATGSKPQTTPTQPQSSTNQSTAKPETHIHVGGSVWFNDPNFHWHECSCGEKVQISRHVYAGASGTTCSLCGYQKAAAPTTEATEPSTEATTAPEETTQPDDSKILFGDKEDNGTSVIRSLAIGVASVTMLGSLGGLAYLWFRKNWWKFQ